MDVEMQYAAESSPAPTPAPVPDPASALRPGLTLSTPFTQNSVSAPRLPSPNRGELSTTIISANTALLVQEHQQQILAIQTQLRTQQVKLDHYNKYGVMPEDSSTKKRALLACRRCRRLRTKCFQVVKGVAPCQKCIESGLDKEACEMPERGQEDVDRKYRRNKDDKAKRDQRRRDSMPPLLGTVNLDGVWELLPALDDIVTAVTAFTTRYFQLGFIPKQVFQDRLQSDQRSISAFLQLSILSISARFTPALVAKHGGPVQAAKVFMGHATSVALSEIYREPSLERCQAFYLLSIAQQGSAMKHQSSINLATAMRMATLLQLHREETYLLANPTHELVFQAESARRTLWMLHCQDNLHSGQRSPALLAASDITALLPSSEDDFDSAREPTSRAALEDTPPALENPGLIAAPGRSLFAASIQAHYYWGVISRRAMRLETCKRPWDPESQFAQTIRRLACWENGLSEEFRWSTATFEGYKKAGVDLGYLGVTMIPRLCNIVIRKTYIPEMLNRDNSGPEMSEFWSSMARDLFRNVEELFDQVEAQYSSLDTDEETGAQMVVFCVYTCGFLACYPHKYPTLCPESAVTHNAEYIVERVLYILDKCKNVWPLATRWRDHLAGFFEGKDVRDTGPEGSMGDNKEETPSASETAQTPSKEPSESSLCGPSDTPMVGYSSGLSSPPRTPSLPPPRLIPDLRILPAPVPHSYSLTRSGPEHYANAPHPPVRPHYYVSPQDQHLASFPQQSTPQLYQQSPTSSYHQNPLSHRHHAASYSQYPQDYEHHPQYPDSLMYHLESLQDRHTASAQQQLTPQGQSRPCVAPWNESVVSRAVQQKREREQEQGEQQQRKQQQREQQQQPRASPYQVEYNSSHEQQLPTFSSISPSQLSFSSHPPRNPWKYLSHRGLSLMTFSEYTWSNSPEDQTLSPLQPQPPPRYQGLGLILEPFDPVRHADATFTPGVVVKPLPGHAVQQAVAVPPAPAPAPVLEQQPSCPLLILTMNDRYVNELIYFMTKGIPFAPPSLGGLRYLSAAA